MFLTKEEELKEFKRLGTELMGMLEYMAKNKVLVLDIEDYKRLGVTINTVLNSKYYVFMPWLIEPLKKFYGSFQFINGDRYYTVYNDSYKELFDPNTMLMLAMVSPKEK